MAYGIQSKPSKPFRYNDKGSIATISKYKAVAESAIGFFRGFVVWWLWLVIHILPITGFKNKIKLVCNWLWNFISNNPTLRIMINPQKH